MAIQGKHEEGKKQFQALLDSNKRAPQTLLDVAEIYRELGLRDDAAVLPVPSGLDLVATTDASTSSMNLFQNCSRNPSKPPGNRSRSDNPSGGRGSGMGRMARH